MVSVALFVAMVPHALAVRSSRGAPGVAQPSLSVATVPHALALRSSRGALGAARPSLSVEELEVELTQLEKSVGEVRRTETNLAITSNMLKLGLLARDEAWSHVHGRMQAKRAAKRPPPLTRWHDPDALLFPGLSTRPFHEAACVASAVALLERFYPLIRGEALALGTQPLQQYRDHGDALLHETVGDSVGDWNVHYLRLEGSDTSTQRRQTPLTARVIDLIPRMTGHAFLSVLDPGTHILPHCGPCNYRLRLQLGLSVPEAGCSIRVGNETRSWAEGRVLILDDAFEHEVWNDSDERRVILIVDVWHPDFSEVEVEWMEATRRGRAGGARAKAD